MPDLCGVCGERAVERCPRCGGGCCATHALVADRRCAHCEASYASLLDDRRRHPLRSHQLLLAYALAGLGILGASWLLSNHLSALGRQLLVGWGGAAVGLGPITGERWARAAVVAWAEAALLISVVASAPLFADLRSSLLRGAHGMVAALPFALQVPVPVIALVWAARERRRAQAAADRPASPATA